jgi:hypothetical protein
MLDNIGGGRAPPERGRRLAGTKAAHLKNTVNNGNVRLNNLAQRRAQEAHRLRWFAVLKAAEDSERSLVGGLASGAAP